MKLPFLQEQRLPTPFFPLQEQRLPTPFFPQFSFGRLVTMTAYNAKGSGNGVEEQATKYLYDSPLNASWQTAAVYPDSTDVPSQDSATKIWTLTTDNGDHTSTEYDRLGRAIGTMDQRGVIHEYSYDTAGRRSGDSFSTELNPVGVDLAVRRIATAYDDVGRVQTVTSLGYDLQNEPTVVLNQVEYVYNSWGKVAYEYQEHDGAVNTATSAHVYYEYDDGAGATNVAKYVRLTDAFYPSGRGVCYGYGTEGAIDDIMSRLSSISDSSAGDLAEYTYLGRGTIVKESHPNVSGGLNLDYDPNNDGSLSGFDRFGRVVDQLWANDAGTTVIDEYKYGYDRAGNRTWKQNAAAVGKALDELYTYDQIDRLTNTQRGTLVFTDPDDPTITATKYQDWTLDGLGNFAEFDDNGTSQTRDVNGANEITSTTGIATPTYDAAGNIISDGTLKYEYDAWNRQTVVRRVSDNSLVATYAYDGHNHRVTKTLAGGTATDYFYNQQWQVVEERTQSGPTTTVDQYVWDQSYVDSPIVRFHDGNGDGDCNPSTDANDTVRHYTWDANHNVTTTITVGHTSTDVQHVAYDAYGKAKVYDRTWTTAADPTENGPLYCGYFFDAETGNYLARNRYYTVVLATWMSRDPIGYRGGINLYEYVDDSPLTGTDPMGLVAIVCHCVKSEGILRGPDPFAPYDITVDCQGLGEECARKACEDSGGHYVGWDIASSRYPDIYPPPPPIPPNPNMTPLPPALPVWLIPIPTRGPMPEVCPGGVPSPPANGGVPGSGTWIRNPPPWDTGGGPITGGDLPGPPFGHGPTPPPPRIPNPPYYKPPSIN